jgi:hypothetical protein
MLALKPKIYIVPPKITGKLQIQFFNPENMKYFIEKFRYAPTTDDLILYNNIGLITNIYREGRINNMAAYNNISIQNVNNVVFIETKPHFNSYFVMMEYNPYHLNYIINNGDKMKNTNLIISNHFNEKFDNIKKYFNNVIIINTIDRLIELIAGYTI